MADLKDLLLKIANNARLTPSELDDLGRFGVETQQRNSFVAGNITPDNRLSVGLPISLIFRERFETAKASVTFDVPADCDHVLIIGSGCVSVANGGNIWAQFNGDTGASNYAWHLISGDGAVVGASEDTSFHAAALGVFGTTGAGAGVNGVFWAEVIHAKSPVWKKSVMSRTYTAEFNAQYHIGSTWVDLTPIRRIEIFGTDNTLAKGTANIIAGSIISAYRLS